MPYHGDRSNNRKVIMSKRSLPIFVTLTDDEIERQKKSDRRIEKVSNIIIGSLCLGTIIMVTINFIKTILR